MITTLDGCSQSELSLAAVDDNDSDDVKEKANDEGQRTCCKAQIDH